MQEMLTEREKDLMNLLVLGKSNLELAEDLIVSVHTIKSMLEKLFIKYNVHNRTQLAVKYALEFKNTELFKPRTE